MGISTRFPEHESAVSVCATNPRSQDWAALCHQRSGRPLVSHPTSASPGSGTLQFDHADRGPTPAELTCAACKQPIRAAYYDINGNLTCQRCCGQIVGAWNRGSPAARFAKALLLGGVAAAVGAGLYFGIEALTGYEFGLVAVVVGVMVGGAVRKGSQGRGGWRYQLLAMFLTYSAVVATDSTMIARELRKEVRARSDSLQALAAPSVAPTNAAIPASVAASSPAPAPSPPPPPPPPRARPPPLPAPPPPLVPPPPAPGAVGGAAPLRLPRRRCPVFGGG